MLQSVHDSLEQLHLKQISLNGFFSTVSNSVSESVNATNATTAASLQNLLKYFETFSQKY